mgnify:CR=1 FL=1
MLVQRVEFPLDALFIVYQPGQAAGDIAGSHTAGLNALVYYSRGDATCSTLPPFLRIYTSSPW